MADTDAHRIATHRTTTIIPPMHDLHHERDVLEYTDISSCDKYERYYREFRLPDEFALLGVCDDWVVYGECCVNEFIRDLLLSQRGIVVEQRTDANDL